MFSIFPQVSTCSEAQHLELDFFYKGADGVNAKYIACAAAGRAVRPSDVQRLQHLHGRLHRGENGENRALLQYSVEIWRRTIFLEGVGQGARLLQNQGVLFCVGVRVFVLMCVLCVCVHRAASAWCAIERVERRMAWLIAGTPS